MIESYDINDYLKDDKELQKAVIRELFKEITTQQCKIDAYKISENEANEIIAELKAYKDVNEDFKTAWEELKAENDRLKEEIKEVKKYQYQQEYLDKEIKEMQKALKTLAEGLNKRQILLQEIKTIAETCCSEINCEECPFTDECNTEMEALGVCKIILKLITKAEEE